MSKKADELFTLLKTIQTTGSFTSSKVNDFVLPGLTVDGFGEVGFPVNDIQAKALIQLAKQAPFGKGGQTIIDTTVRNSWEIDAEYLSLNSSSWGSFMNKIIKKVKKDLGLGKTKVEASLYKLLIYEEAGFFKLHKDSEKEVGMFATLIITLPSKYTGGELCVQFDGKEEVFDFSEDAANFKLSYAAFFADCDHEVKSLKSGYRICLVYNLIQKKGHRKPTAAIAKKEVEKMVPILESMKDTFTNKPLAVLLDHQYTPTNFTFDALKSNDKPRAESLMQAAEKAGYFAKLGLVTHYMMGDLEGGNYYGNYGYGSRQTSTGETEMGDVHDIETKIEHWSDDGFPAMGEISLDEENLLTNITIGEGKPIEEEEEGFTGNAGMTMEYWYHYGAVILWPKNNHADLLMVTDIPVRLAWLDFYLEHWGNTSLRSPQYVRDLVGKFDLEEIKDNYRYKQLDFTALAVAFGRLKDASFLKNTGLPLLELKFEQIEISTWNTLLQQFKSDDFADVFQKKGRSGDKNKLNHLLGILLALVETASTEGVDFVVAQTKQLPVYISNTKIHELEQGRYDYIGDQQTKIDQSKDIVMKSIQLSRLMKEHTDWAADMLAVFTASMPRTYVNEVLIAAAFDKKQDKGKLLAGLKEVGLKNLKNRVNNKPQPPADWRREVPTSGYYQKEWDILQFFLESPTIEVFDYRANQSYRSRMASAVTDVKVDLKMETIKKGSPHILRLTKTQAAYELKLKQWKKDVELLDKIRE